MIGFIVGVLLIVAALTNSDHLFWQCVAFAGVLAVADVAQAIRSHGARR